MKNAFGIKFWVLSIIAVSVPVWWWFGFDSPKIGEWVESIEEIGESSAMLAIALICYVWTIELKRLLQDKIRPDYLLIVAIASFGVAAFLFLKYGIAFVKNSMLYFDKHDISGSDAWTAYIRVVSILGLYPLIVALVIPLYYYRWECFKETPRYRRWFAEGRGGSARWAGVGTLEEREYSIEGEWNLRGAPKWMQSDGKEGMLSSHVFLGRALIDHDPFMRLVGVKDDEHIITIGTTGSGKSTTAIWPNLAMYNGSAIVLDMKGEHARQTFFRRCSGAFKQVLGVHGNASKYLPNGRCYMLDPFGENRDLVPSSRYNPLSEIDINNEQTADAMLSAIADGCVNPESEKNKHFEDGARAFIKGLVAHVLTTYQKENHNLPFVLDLFKGIDPDTGIAVSERFTELLKAMMMNGAVGGIAQDGAKILIEAGPNERGSFMTTIGLSLEWIGKPAMRKHLIASDFRFSDIDQWQKWVKGVHSNGNEDAEGGYYKDTIYIVFPEQQMKDQMRWMRTLASVAARAMQYRRTKPEAPTLFILDEFAALGGRIEAISSGFSTFRSYKIKMWVLLQSIEQLEKDYPDRWNTITGSGTIQAFGIQDPSTAEWISSLLGGSLRMRKEGNLFNRRTVHESYPSLLTPHEIMSRFGKSANQQIVKTNEGEFMALERLTYKPLNGSKSVAGDALKGHFEDW